MAKLSQYIWTIVEQLPSLLTMIGCLIFAMTRWKRHPKVSLLLVISLGWLVIHVFAFLVIFDVVPRLFVKPGNFENMDSVMRTVSLVLGLLFNTGLAVSFALLLAAVFTQRNSSAPNAAQPR